MIVSIGLWASAVIAQPYPTGVEPPPSRVPVGDAVKQLHPNQPPRITPPVIGGQAPVNDPNAAQSGAANNLIPAPPTAQVPMHQPGQIIRASLMIGQPVWNGQDQLIGTVADVVIDTRTSPPVVLYAVSSGLAAVPTGWIVVPTNVMSVRHETEGGNRLVLNLGVNQVRNCAERRSESLEPPERPAVSRAG